jgi:uncharacterized protein (DUF849 family)
MKVWNMHLIPSLEMPELDLSCFFVAKVDGKIVGASGYKVLSKTRGKTTLLAIYPEFQGSKIGKALQEERLKKMFEMGIQTVTTNADYPSTIIWYKKHFAYKEVGKLKKLMTFSLKDVDYWTTLEMNLVEYFKTKNQKEQKINKYIQEHDCYPLSDYSPLIINVCLTGMIPTKISTRYVPISVDEIIEDAIKVYDAGARIVHIHARDKDAKPTSNAKYYEEIITGIKKERPKLICCTTTSGRDNSSFEARSEVLHLTGIAKPDMASLTLGSLNFLTGASVNTIDTVERLAMLMKEKNIKPELEIFDSGMINLAKYLQRHSILPKDNYFNILLGNLNTATASINTLSALYNDLPENSTWAASGLGQFQLPMNTAAIIGGGHVRVGIEDSIYYDYKQTKLASNEELVKRVIRLSNELQRPIATSMETKSIIHLNTSISNP